MVLNQVIIKNFSDRLLNSLVDHVGSSDLNSEVLVENIKNHSVLCTNKVVETFKENQGVKERIKV